MSSAATGTNAAKTPYGCNNDRPGGASELAASRDLAVLQFAIAVGNRQTRRLAQKNAKRIERHSNQSAAQHCSGKRSAVS